MYALGRTANYAGNFESVSAASCDKYGIDRMEQNHGVVQNETTVYNLIRAESFAQR